MVLFYQVPHMWVNHYNCDYEACDLVDVHWLQGFKLNYAQ